MRLIICPSVFESIQFLTEELVPLIYFTLFTVYLIPVLLPQTSHDKNYQDFWFTKVNLKEALLD
jgi:hypothetical protein